jgi:hypothetical protein
MLDFVNRTAEKERLQKALNQDSAAFIALYGRVAAVSPALSSKFCLPKIYRVDEREPVR